MNIDQVNRGVAKHKTRKRIGRGIGSGQGKTAGRGHKGAGSRTSYKQKKAFEGGQMPLVRRIPKRGFTNRFARFIAEINLADIEELYAAGEEVSPVTLAEKGLLRGQFDQLKVLGDGELTKGLKISAHRFSKSALEKIQKAGGEVVVLPGPKPVVKNKMNSRKQQHSQKQQAH